MFEIGDLVCMMCDFSYTKKIGIILGKSEMYYKIKWIYHKDMSLIKAYPPWYG